MADKMLKIGVVTGAHGIKGDLKVFPLTDDITRFERLKNVITEHKFKQSEYEIEAIRYHKKLVILKLAGISSMDAAVALKGAYFLVDKKDAIPLDNDEYYVSDLYDMDVYTTDGENLGKITDVIRTGANDVYEVERKLYIPAIKECIVEVDVSGGKMVVKLLEGLR